MPDYDYLPANQTPAPLQQPSPLLCEVDPLGPTDTLDPDSAWGLQGLCGNSWLQTLMSSQEDSGVCEAPFLDAGPEVETAPAGPTDDEQVDAALADVNKHFETGLFDWAVTDEDATNALNTLTALPPELQGKAIEKMDANSFDTLLSEVPDMDRTRFKDMMENTHDPERKLKLWAEYHKASVKADAELEKAATADEGSWWPWSRTDEQNENRRMNSRRDEITSSTADEVDDEVDFAMGQLADGKLTEQDVIDLGNRKQREHEIEMKYNVNLTNDEGAREHAIAGQTKGTKIAWDMNELNQVDTALGRMPEAHVKHNPMLQEIRRAEVSGDDKDQDNPNIGGQHGGGVIRIYDLGVNANYRHNGDPVELQDPANSHPLTPLEETLTHETGHDVHDQNDDAFQRFRASAGWEEGLGSGRLSDDGLSDQQVKDLEDGTVSQVVVNGKVYQVDPYNTGPFGGKRFTVYNDGAIASSANGATPNNRGWDTWSYARTNSKDHFAESYMKAVEKPETLAHDLLDAPSQRVQTATASRDAAKVNLDTLKAQNPPASPDQIKAAEGAVTMQEAALADAQGDQGAQQTQWNILRNDIFHTDVATESAAARLQAKGVTPEKIAEFRAKAGRAATPEQVARLEAGY